MAVQNLSLQQAVHRREGLMQQVNSNIKRLNTNFSSNPEKIPVDTLYQLVGDLRETNAQIGRLSRV